MGILKTIEFRGQTVLVDEARKMMLELEQAISLADPCISEYSAKQVTQVYTDPRWHSMPDMGLEGSVLSFRTALGWVSYMVPWGSVGHLIGLLSRQMAASILQRQLPDQKNTKH